MSGIAIAADKHKGDVNEGFVTVAAKTKDNDIAVPNNENDFITIVAAMEKGKGLSPCSC